MSDTPDWGGIDAGDEETTTRLLRLAGSRVEVDPSRQARVRRAFLDECRATARARRRRRILMATGSLAAAAALLFALRASSPRVTAVPDRVLVATVERLDGRGAVLTADRASAVDPGPGRGVHAGDWLDTGDGGRVAVRLAEGASVRIDLASRVRFLSTTTLELAGGALYVDSGPASPRLEIRTDLGTVWDVGTQFEVRRDGSSLRVRVRSGLVEVRREGETASARPGTELIAGSGGVASRPFAPYGPEWAWAAALAPAFETEGRPLDAFLQHLCREQGWTLTYVDATLARDASGMILFGSTKGLQPSEALAVNLATTGLTYRLENGELRVARQDPR